MKWEFFLEMKKEPLIVYDEVSELTAEQWAALAMMKLGEWATILRTDPYDERETNP